MSGPAHDKQTPDAHDIPHDAVDAIVARAAHDASFRAQLLIDPRAAIHAAFGITIPPTYRIRFIERDRDLDALVVLSDFAASQAPADGALSDDELEQVAGGVQQHHAWAKPPE